MDLARRIVAFPFFLGIFRMEELLVFLMMVFLGWLAVWSFHLLAVCQDEEDVFFFETTNGCDDSD